MMQYSSLSGLRAYWMLHSPTTPKCRTTFKAVLRSWKYSRLERVWLGAITIESPVCTPRGSKFWRDQDTAREEKRHESG